MDEVLSEAELAELVDLEQRAEEHDRSLRLEEAYETLVLAERDVEVPEGLDDVALAELAWDERLFSERLQEAHEALGYCDD